MNSKLTYTFLAVIGLAAGCAAPEWDAEACPGFTNTQAIGLGWESFNHRISVWDVRPTRGCIADRLAVGSIGGDFSTGAITSDTPTVEYAHRTVFGDVRDFGATPVTFEGVIGSERRIEVTETFSRVELALRGYPDMAAVIRGIRFSTDVPYADDAPEDLTYDSRLGWTMRGVAAGVSAQPNGEDVDVTWWAEFEPAAAPDRPDHNAALPFAQVEVALDTVVIGVGDVPVHTGTTAYAITAQAPGPGSGFQPEHAPDEDQLTVVSGEALPQPGFVGLTAFAHTFEIPSTCAADNECSPGVSCESGTCAIPNGEYIREMTFAADLESYDPKTGEGVIRYDGYGSTATPIIWFHDLDFRTEASWVWVQAGVPTEVGRVEESFRTGRASWDLD